MENFSYEYKGKVYDFVLSLKAKTEIEKEQKKQLKNPAVAKFALSAQGGDLDLNNLSDEQLTEILPHMDELGDLDPLDIGYIVLSNYARYRAEMSRNLFDDIVEDMESNLGLEETFDFFVRLQQSVFTRLANMQKTQVSNAESKTALLKAEKA